MKIVKCSGLGQALDKIIEIAGKEEKTAQAAPAYQVDPAATQNLQQAINPLQRKKPTLQTGQPQMSAPDLTLQPSQRNPQAAGPAAPGAAPAGAPAAGKPVGLPLPAGPHGPQLQQQWQQIMKDSGPHIAQMGQWAQKMAAQPMVAKNPNLSASLNGFAQTIAQLPNNPQSVPQLQKQIEGLHGQLEDFWLKWRDAYQRGHQFMQQSTNQLKAFDQFVNKNLNMKAFQNAGQQIA